MTQSILTLPGAYSFTLQPWHPAPLPKCYHNPHRAQNSTRQCDLGLLNVPVRYPGGNDMALVINNDASSQLL